MFHIGKDNKTAGFEQINKLLKFAKT